MKLVATTYAGLENVLAEELINLQADDVQVGRRAVYFSGDLEMMYRANYSLRTALKVLVNLEEFKIKKVDDLYKRAADIKWEKIFEFDATFAVQAIAFNSDLFRNSMFAGLKVKDAIVDRFRRITGQRPSVDIKFPQVVVNVHIANDNVIISLDASGDPLFKRKYRTERHEAPISEALAAGMILLSGWNKKSPIADPMCGSGTIVIEAAMMAKNIRPGDIGRDYAFMNWKNFDITIYNKIKEEANIDEDVEFSIYGSDISRRNIQMCFKHAENAGVDDIVRFKQKDIANLDRPKNVDLFIFNPPYGERIESGDQELYGVIGEKFKHEFEGSTAWIISTKPCLKWIGLKPSTKINLLNGSIECSFRKYETFAGTRKEMLEEGK
ncbi:MAG: class I SAM-dependent RNA methyltransferase [Mangrovibacterium sp.]